MQQIGKDFFNLPLQEKLQHYSDDPAKKFRLSTSFNVKKEKIHNWRDYLRLHCYPLEDYVHEWPSNPPSFKYNPNYFHLHMFLHSIQKFQFYSWEFLSLKNFISVMCNLCVYVSLSHVGRFVFATQRSGKPVQ
ncbi:hypothetical protein AMTR_s00001p00271970 [Amborella trichopoda]|uniref:Non-haem dioxygenase N-terminal domain-containing protein n=1 Tax=Amborella trichopoda TaxID=13333 RepID=W1NMV9_AMBTC|nr:hypothetical protein AMTR_s00001p00271970 [Amborella trichopoda]